jgi:hypothetical protein
MEDFGKREKLSGVTKVFSALGGDPILSAGITVCGDFREGVVI